MRKILIVDDSKVVRCIIKDELKNDYEILEVENGLKALDIISKNKFIPDLITLDLEMPEIDGFNTCKRLYSGEFSEHFNLSTSKIEGLKYSSKLAAKVDSAAVQDNHQLYHHVFLFDELGNWTVIQQGLDPESSYARRYHWLSEHVESFTQEPHDAILGEHQLSRV